MVTNNQSNKLTRKILCQGLLDAIDKRDESVYRDLEYIRSLISFLFEDDWSDSGYCNTSYDVLANDQFLLGYTFLLKANPQFTYTWRYLRQKKDEYISFLKNVQGYITQICSDISEIAPDLMKIFNLELQEIKLVIDDTIFVVLKSSIPYYEFDLEIKNLDRILSASSDKYVLRVMYGKTTVGVYTRKDPSDIDILVEQVKVAQKLIKSDNGSK